MSIVNEQFIARLKRFEGIDTERRVYQDAGGYAFGWGTNLSKIPKSWYLAIAEFALRYIANETEAELKLAVPEYKSLPDKVKIALLDMAYNIGVPGLLGFKKMWEHLKNGDYEAASYEVLNSQYAKQVPNRAKANADLIRYGKSD